MAGETTKGESKTKKEAPEVKFKCRLCEKEKPISQMRVLTRFRPVLVVCQDCEPSVR